MTTADSAWLRIPARDYEAHMEQVGQSAALRGIFARVYAATRPRRVLVLGCTTGKDLAELDPAVTTRAVGVDVSPDYLAVARADLEGQGRMVELVAGDVLDVELGAAEFDLVHAALLVEYVAPPALLRRIAAWLARDGVCAIVSQNPAEGVGAVSETPYDSLRVLEGRMSLVGPDELRALAADAGLARASFELVPLPGGKTFSVSTFTKARLAAR
jgi:SAM-dependent methyltransferase